MYIKMNSVQMLQEDTGEAINDVLSGHIVQQILASSPIARGRRVNEALLRLVPKSFAAARRPEPGVFLGGDDLLPLRLLLDLQPDGMHTNQTAQDIQAVLHELASVGRGQR